MSLLWPARHVWAFSQVQLIITNTTMGQCGLRAHCWTEVCIFVCFLHGESCVCVCFSLSWHFYSLGNYSANKLGGRLNRESCFLGLIDSPDVLKVWSVSVLDFWFCNEVVTSIIQNAQTAHFRQRAGWYWNSKEWQNRDGEVLWACVNRPWSCWRHNEGQKQQKPVLLQHTMLVGSRHLFPAMTFPTTCCIRAAARQPLVSVCFLRHSVIPCVRGNRPFEHMKTQFPQPQLVLNFHDWCKPMTSLKGNLTQPSVRSLLQHPYICTHFIRFELF